MNSLRTAMAAAGLIVSTVCGAAPTVTVKFDNPIFNNTGSDNVTITETTLGSAGVAAGRFQGAVTAYEDVSPSIFVDGLDNLFMYCYDIREHIGSGWVVEKYSINSSGPLARTLDVLGAVNWVMNGNSNDWVDKYAWLHPQDTAQSAAIQLAIWESKYDDAGWNLASGSFKASGLETGTTEFWNKIVAAVGNANVKDLPSEFAMTLEKTGAQDMITGDPPSRVPLPGTLALLGAGLAGLGLARRKSGR